MISFFLEKDLPFDFTFGHCVENMMLGVMKRKVRESQKIEFAKKKQHKRGALILLNCLVNSRNTFFWISCYVK